MPIAFDPNQTLELTLWHEKEMDRRPTFIFRFLSAREHLAVAEAFDAYDQATGDPDMIATAVRGIRVGLVDWRHVTDRAGRLVAFEPDRLEDILTSLELQEIKDRLLMEMALTELDRKKSAWPSLSPGAGSAAGAGAASASTHPAAMNPPLSSAPAAMGLDAPPVAASERSLSTAARSR